MNRLCAICRNELSDGESNLSRRWHFDCEKCQLCNSHFPNPGRIEECLNLGIPISHQTCFYESELQKIRQETIPITQSMLDAANEKLLLMRFSFQPPTSDISQLSSLLASITNFGANVEWLLSQTKDKIRIQDSQEYSEKIKTKKIEDRVKNTEIAKSQERSSVLQAERNDPTGKLRDTRKAIESFMKSPFNMSKEAATQLVESMAASGQKGTK